MKRAWRFKKRFVKSDFIPRVRSQRGQGLVEYLLIVALIGVATMGIMRVLGQTVSAKFATVTYALQGSKKSVTSERIEASHHKKKDMSDFFDGVSSK